MVDISDSIPDSDGTDSRLNTSSSVPLAASLASLDNVASDDLLIEQPTLSEPATNYASIIESYWTDRTARAGNTRNIDRILLVKERVSEYIAANIGPTPQAAQLERFISSIDWYNQRLKQGEFQHGDYSQLKYLGISEQKVAPLWGPLTEIARECHLLDEVRSAQITRQFTLHAEIGKGTWALFRRQYNFPDKPQVESPALTSYFKEAMQRGIVDKDDACKSLLKRILAEAEVALSYEHSLSRKSVVVKDQPASEVPISLTFLNQLRAAGAIMPDYASVLNLNKAIQNGGTGFVFCCPDYAREQNRDGSYSYAMNGLGTGMGLTAERSLPIVKAVIERIASLPAKTQNFNLYLGIADFEATESNAIITGCGSTAEFRSRLSLSLKTIADFFCTSAPAGTEVQRVEHPRRDDDLPTFRLTVINEKTLEPICNISVGAITAAFKGQSITTGSDAYEFTGAASFNNLVTDARSTLSKMANSEHMKRKLDLLVTLRLDLLIKWSDELAPSLVKQLRDNGYKQEKSELIRTLQFGEVEFLRGNVTEETKAAFEAVTYLRNKVATQGAEYYVMHQLIAGTSSSFQIAADALNMWQVFGKKSIPLLGVRGNYQGADALDLS